MLLTVLSDFRQLLPLDLVQNLTVIAFTSDVDAENNGLINHLIEVDGGTDVLGNFRLRIHKHIPRYMHELDQGGEVFLDAAVIHDDQGGAFLRRHPFVWIIQAR